MLRDRTRLRATGVPAVVLAIIALSCGSKPDEAPDLSVWFPDVRSGDPGVAPDDGRVEDPGLEAGPDQGADPGTETAADAGNDPGLADEGGSDPDSHDLGTQDPDTQDPGAQDPGGPDAEATDPGPADPGTEDPGALDATQDPGTTDPGARDNGPDLPGCGSGPACAPGTICIDGVCDTCRFQFACGPTCANCAGTDKRLCLDGTCVQCRVQSDCNDGSWCRPDTHACEPCGDTDAAHCGETCLACPAETPVCEGGACRCNATSCGTLFCLEGACQGCDIDSACGPSCAPCPLGTPRCVGGACVACRDPGDCPTDQWCNGGECRECTPNDPAHCGSTCAACGGDVPACVAGECVCDEGSCGAGRRCVGGDCEACDLDEACGPACEACASPAPFCLGGACRQCRTAEDCPADWACGLDGACMDPCAGTLGCADDRTPDGRKCSTAKVLGRTAVALGISVNGDTTDQGGDDDLPSGSPPDCWDGQDDQMYRVYLRTGDRLDLTATPLEADYQMSLKVYRGTACDDNWKNDLVACQWKGGDGKAQSIAYTATAAGWVTVVVDGASAFDAEYDFGPYRLSATLACADANCCCR